MFTQARLLFISVFFSVILTACGTTTAEVEIKIGMTEQEITKQLGEPSLNQSRIIDALVATHTEWTDKDGTLSVQFINGAAQFHQFTAASN